MRNHTASVVTPPDLDGVEQTLDSDLRGDTGLDLASHMDMMMLMIVDLSKNINDLDQVSQLQPVTAPSMLAVSHHAPEKNRGQTVLVHVPEMEEAVCRQLEQRLHQIPLLEAAFSQEESSSEDEHMAKKRKRALRSGRDHAGATSIRKRITWSIKVIYRVIGQPATYKDHCSESVQDTQGKEHMMVHLDE